MTLNRKIANINVENAHTSKTAKTGTVNLVAEHVGIMRTCSITKFTVPIFTHTVSPDTFQHTTWTPYCCLHALTSSVTC